MEQGGGGGFESSHFLQQWQAVAEKKGVGGNGALGPEDIQEVLQSFGISDFGGGGAEGNNVLELVVSKLDTDGDGKISFEEFMGGLGSFLEGKSNSSPSLRDISNNEEDENDNEGELSYESGNDLSFEENEALVNLFNQFDTDKDGKLNRAEIERLCSSLESFLGSQSSPSSARPNTEVTSSLKKELLKNSQLDKSDFVDISLRFIDAMAFRPSHLPSSPSPSSPRSSIGNSSPNYSFSLSPKPSPLSNSLVHSSSSSLVNVEVMRDLKEENKYLKRMNEGMKDQIRNFEEQIEEGNIIHQNSRVEFSKLMSLLDQKKNEVMELKNSINKYEKQDEKRSPKQDVAEYTKKLKQLEEKITSLESEKDTLKTSQNDVLIKLEKLKTEKLDLYKQNTEQKSKYKKKSVQKNKQISTLELETESLKEKQQQLQLMITRLNQENKKNRIQLKNDAKQIAHQESQIFSLRNSSSSSQIPPSSSESLESIPNTPSLPETNSTLVQNLNTQNISNNENQNINQGLVDELNKKITGLEETINRLEEQKQSNEAQTKTLLANIELREKQWREKQGKYMSLQIQVKEHESIRRERKLLIQENERLLTERERLRADRQIRELQWMSEIQDLRRRIRISEEINNNINSNNNNNNSADREILQTGKRGNGEIKNTENHEISGELEMEKRRNAELELEKDKWRKDKWRMEKEISELTERERMRVEEDEERERERRRRRTEERRKREGRGWGWKKVFGWCGGEGGEEEGGGIVEEVEMGVRRGKGEWKKTKREKEKEEEGEQRREERERAEGGDGRKYLDGVEEKEERRKEEE
eukprot:TRINITY_DN104_c1_g2_i1.p1 TRINITY_DN104_c1_g2~~TRINITY_DN104_c1_g2_i1.p1  ORF type:complete len:817 (+),score=370.09 TRINITY_DN104_c1_g2_i1:81-2531(+)